MKRLTRERERIGLSKQALAQRAQISPVYVSQAESGRRIPYKPEIERLAEALGWQGNPEQLLEECSDAPA